MAMQHPHPHQVKRRRAKIWLVLIFLVVCGANALFVQMSFHPQNAYPLLCGPAIGAVLWTTVLLIAMWRRHGWARYVLCTLMVLMVAGFSSALLTMASGNIRIDPRVYQLGGGALGLYMLALIPLGASRSIRYLMSPITAAGR